ncbi:MAG: SDR family NAD(P)-dependent oxidoreductase [Myxococcales bacterium]|nr:SDR family NAD(P)-dependent oxidoreductase [Myxococcales bacterium]
MFASKLSKQSSAVVTGAGSGIGRAFALELAARGGRVVCSDIQLGAAEETARLIHAAGGQALALVCDVSKLEEVEALAERAEQWLGGPVDLVVNNAGVGVGGLPIGEQSIEDWRFTIDVNLWGVVHGCHVFTPRLRALGRGGIINVSSAASFGSAPLMGAYNASKAAVLAISETLRAELVGTDVRVAVLCPTFVQTNILHNGRATEATTKLASRLMARTGVSPASVAKTTLNALDRDQLYVLPQLDARMFWRMKRLAPSATTRGTGWIARAFGPREGADAPKESASHDRGHAHVAHPVASGRARSVR